LIGNRATVLEVIYKKKIPWKIEELRRFRIHRNNDGVFVIPCGGDSRFCGLSTRQQSLPPEWLRDWVCPESSGY